MAYSFNPFTGTFDKIKSLITSLRATANSMFYSDNTGAIKELPLGNAGKVLTSTGDTTAPIWAVAGEISTSENLDGGFANSTYLTSQSVDGGGA